MDTIPADRCRLQPSFWRAIERIGLHPSTVLRQARLPVTLPLESQPLVTTAQFFAIWRVMEALTRDPGLWLRFVEATDAVGHQPMFVAACYASDYRDAIARVVRFKRLTTPERFLIEERDGEVSIAKEWFHATSPEPAMSVDVSFGFMVALGRKGTRTPLAPVRVELARAGPVGDAHRAYFGCPIRHGAPRDTLVLRASDLDRPFPGHNAELLAVLTPALAAALGEFGPESTFVEQVKVVLKRSLAGGRPEVSDVARGLGTSERTLQRRITGEGTTFRALVTEARQELGRQLLSDPSAEVDEVACLLGFQDPTSFYRAFRGWEGVTPARWRELNRAGPRLQ